MVKVLAIDASRANKIKRTGVEWYSYFLIQEAKKIIPADIKVILYLQNELLPDMLPLPDNWQVKILRWPWRFWTFFRLSYEMLRAKPDILFVPSNIIPFFAPKKTFTTIHDIGFKHFAQSYAFMERILQNWGLRRAIKKTEKIFVPSEFTKSELCRESNSLHGLVVISLGYDREHFSPLAKTREVLKKYGINEPYIYFIGRLESKKNINNIIKAFDIFNQWRPEYSLVLAGSEGYGFDKDLVKNKNIKFLGYIPQLDAPALMANAEALLYPSLYEGFGFPILEAMACGIPVITSKGLSTEEIAGDSALYANPQSAEDIAEQLRKIAENQMLSAEFSAKGIERAKKFSWQKCARKTFENILGDCC